MRVPGLVSHSAQGPPSEVIPQPRSDTANTASVIMSLLFLGEAGGDFDHARVYEPLGQPPGCIYLHHEAGCHPTGWRVVGLILHRAIKANLCFDTRIDLTNIMSAKLSVRFNSLDR